MSNDVASSPIPTFIVRELAVLALKQEVPKPKLRNLKRRIEGFSRHLDQQSQVMSVKCTSETEKQLVEDRTDIFLRAGPATSVLSQSRNARILLLLCRGAFRSSKQQACIHGKRETRLLRPTRSYVTSPTFSTGGRRFCGDEGYGDCLSVET